MLSMDAIKRVVLDGSRRSMGMPRFKDFKDNDLLAVQHFVRRQAKLPEPCKACQRN